MKRDFIFNVAFLIGINLLIKPFYIFGIDRTVQNVVGVKEYGFYASLLSFTYLLQIVNDFGIQYFNNRDIAKNQQLLKRYFPNIVVLKCLLGLSYLTFTFLIGYSIGYGIAQFKLLAFLAVNQILISFIFYLRSNISGLHYYRTDSIFSALDKLMMISLCSFLLWGPWSSDFVLEWFVYAQTISLLITALLALTWLLLKTDLKLKIIVEWPLLWEILKKSAPYALAVFLMGMYTRIDMVMLERLLPNGQSEAGIYAAAYRLLDAASMVGFLIAGLLLPMFSKMLKNEEDVRGLFKMSFLLMFFLTTSVSSFCWFFQNELMQVLYSEATTYWGQILGYLMLSYIPIGSIYITGTLISAIGNLKGLNIIAFIGAILNILLNLLLIDKYNALGATLATASTQFLVSIGQLYLIKQLLKTKNSAPQ